MILDVRVTKFVFLPDKMESLGLLLFKTVTVGSQRIMSLLSYIVRWNFD